MLWFLQAHDVDEIFYAYQEYKRDEKKVNKNNNGIVSVLSRVPFFWFYKTRL
jgi:hypothetical protein